MSLRCVTREEAAPVLARQYTESYPGFPQSADEVLAYLASTLEGAHEEHWVVDDGSVVVVLMAPDTSHPPTRLEGEVHTSRPDDYAGAVEFSESRCKDLGCPHLCIWSRSDRTDRIGTLTSRGYELIQTAPSSRLDLERFDGSKFAAKLAACPYRIASIAELAAEGMDWMPRLYESTTEMAQDVPDPHDFVPMPYEQYAEMLKNPVIYDHRLMFVALDGDQIIGYTRVTPMQLDPTLVATGLSGVLRACRRQGVVTALKVRAIESLRERGFKWLRTENDETNPMYQLNLELGFEWEWDWVQFGRASL